ncbi:class I tRNA ligase family protein, partial [Streptomyces europaeiscabiei]|uniref:class I tRNA ligase family protein n=1 Tax=Streptomyces europaeiscabiei TaxID=146819 RepID=UPI0038F6CC10
DGYDVFFLTGTDEHGLKMLQTAGREGMTVQALADRNSSVFKEMDALLGVSYDDFIRTTESRHHKSVQEVWRRMAANGDIYKEKYAGW